LKDFGSTEQKYTVNNIQFSSTQPRGISTAANWIKDIRVQKLLIVDRNLNNFLENRAVAWWPTSTVLAFPKVGATESKMCQDYVNTILEQIINCRGNVYKKSYFGLARRSNLQVTFHSQPLDCHNVVSFSSRKPDICCYQGDIRGSYSITMLGHVKGCGARNADFPESEIGHILDMATDLIIKQQFTRLFMYCFLTDGYRFQFFKVIKNRNRSNIFTYQQSAVYCKELGWQVLYIIYNFILFLSSYKFTIIFRYFLDC
jgi:hypothetical protein